MSGVLRGSARSGLGLWINFLSLWLVRDENEKEWEVLRGIMSLNHGL